MEETVTISKTLYEAMQEDVNTLKKLYNAGVDNWEWYEEALCEGDSNDS